MSKDPINLVTSKFKPLEIIHQHAGFVIAMGILENMYMGIACRWHPKEGLGYPNGFGKEQWFLLPGEVKSINKDVTSMDAGRYKETLSIDFTSYVDSSYILSWDVMYKEIFRFGIDNKRISIDKNFITDDPKDRRIRYEDLHLAEINFFTPFAIITNLPTKEIYYRSKEHNAIGTLRYDYIYEPYFSFELSLFEELGFSLSEIE